ncbi:hypothetical protein RIF29_19418 [Crotalaria pallida]|uniref:Uncharacterized protein n=1 Tax=Crotalaria pallida TaxID=3830 RepID=A0AAN9F7S2_CROPI
MEERSPPTPTSPVVMGAPGIDNTSGVFEERAGFPCPMRQLLEEKAFTEPKQPCFLVNKEKNTLVIESYVEGETFSLAPKGKGTHITLVISLSTYFRSEKLVFFSPACSTL